MHLHEERKWFGCWTARKSANRLIPLSILKISRLFVRAWKQRRASLSNENTTLFRSLPYVSRTLPTFVGPRPAPGPILDHFLIQKDRPFSDETKKHPYWWTVRINAHKRLFSVKTNAERWFLLFIFIFFVLLFFIFLLTHFLFSFCCILLLGSSFLYYILLIFPDFFLLFLYNRLRLDLRIVSILSQVANSQSSPQQHLSLNLLMSPTRFLQPSCRKSLRGHRYSALTMTSWARWLASLEEVGKWISNSTPFP